MFRRAFWFTTGAAAGVWATTKVNRKLRSLAPESLTAQAADRAALTGHRLRRFALDVRDGMADREAALHEALGLDAAPGDGEPPAERGRPALRPPPRSGAARQLPRADRPYPQNPSYDRKEDH